MLILTQTFVIEMHFYFCSFRNSDLNSLSKPLSTLTFLPFTLTLVRFFSINKDTLTVLLIMVPASCVCVTIGELHCTVSLLLSIDKGTLIMPTIFVIKYTMALEDTTFEFSYICAFSLSKVVSSLTVEFAINEITLIIASILPLVTTLTFLLSVSVVSFVFHCLLDDFSTFAMLSIFFPLSIIGRVLTLENTVAIGLIVSPFTLVQVSISLSHTTDSRHDIVVKHTLVDATILHFEFTNSILAHLSI